MDCRELKTMMDSYISDELLVETNHEVLRHLENCPACRREMADLRLLNLHLRQAIKNADEFRIDPAFAMRVTAGLRETALQPSVRDFSNPRIAALGFACILLFVFGGFVWINQSKFAAKPEEASNISPNKVNTTDLENAVRVSWNEMTEHAVGDHENCAVKFRLNEDPISLDEAAVRYGSFNKDLDKTVDTALQAAFKGNDSNGIEFIEAHSCIFDGQRFAHIVMRHKGRIVSVLVTDSDLPPGNDKIQTAHYSERLNTAGFHVGHHAVFVVSELPDAENMTIAQTLVPAIRLHAEKLGA